MAVSSSEEGISDIEDEPFSTCPALPGECPTRFANIPPAMLEMEVSG
jgi:hypothetical protein